MKQLEEFKVVGQHEGTKPRKILVGLPELEMMAPRLGKGARRAARSLRERMNSVTRLLIAAFCFALALVAFGAFVVLLGSVVVRSGEPAIFVRAGTVARQSLDAGRMVADLGVLPCGPDRRSRSRC